MKKQKAKLHLGNCIMSAALGLVLLGSTMTVASASQGNKTFDFAFNSYNDVRKTESRTKWADGGSAFMYCVNADVSGSTYKAKFCFWNSYDGTQSTSYKVLGKGTKAYFQNGGLTDDITWFEAQLYDSSDGDAFFTGQWRPDSAL